MATSTAISAQGTSFYIAGTDGSSITITGITKATAAVVTATNTLSAGDVVVFGAVTNMPEIAGMIGIVSTATSSSFTVNIDSSGFAAAGTSGTATPKTWTAVGNCSSYSGFDGQKSEIDVSNLQSAAKEFIPGLEDFGQITVEVQVDDTDAGQLACRANKSANVNTYFKIALPNSKKRVWKGFVKQFGEQGGVDQVVKGSIVVRATGAVSRA